MNSYQKIKKTQDFTEARRRGVGSSDIPTLAGLNRMYGETTFTLWQDKTGRKKSDNFGERIHWGHKLEGLILHEWVARRFGVEVADDFYLSYLRDRSFEQFKIKTECFHPKYRYAMAHADLLTDQSTKNNDYEVIDDLPAIIEAKSHRGLAARRGVDLDYGYNPDDQSQDGIPARVFLQVQWQMFCYAVPEAWVVALIDTSDYREYGPIKADPRVQEKCLALADRFWWHVENDREPPPETWGDVCALFPEQTKTTAVVSGTPESEIRAAVLKKKRYSALIEKYKAKIEDIKNAAGLLIGSNQILTAGNGEVLAQTYNKSKESIALSEVKKQAPELEAALRAKGLVNKSSWREIRL